MTGRTCAGCGGPLTDRASTDYCWNNCRRFRDRIKYSGISERRSCFRCGNYLAVDSSYDYCQRNNDCKRLYTRQYRTGGIEQIKKRSVFKPDDIGWIYGLVDSHGQVIYVGQTMARPEIRFGQHRYKEHWWSDQVAGFVCFEVRYSRLTATENYWIHSYHPWGNTRCVPCGVVKIDRRVTPSVPLPTSEFGNNVRGALSVEAGRRKIARRIEALGLTSEVNEPYDW